MRFLRVLGLGLVEARLLGKVMPVIAFADRAARGRDRAVVHLHPVGAHIGDRARFVERLREPHGVAGGIPKLARGLLLQCRGGEGRRGIALERPGFDLLDGEAPRLHRCLGGKRATLVPQSQPVELVALELDQSGVECGAIML